MLTFLHHYFFHIPTSIHLPTTVSNFTFQTNMKPETTRPLYGQRVFSLRVSLFLPLKLRLVLLPGDPSQPLVSPSFPFLSFLPPFYIKSRPLGPPAGAYLSTAIGRAFSGDLKPVWAVSSHLGYSG